MPEGEHFEAVDKVFPFVFDFIASATGFMHSALLTWVRKMCMGLLNKLKKYWDEEESSLDGRVDVKNDIKWLKEVLKRKFHENWETGIYALKFHLLHHIVADHERLEVFKT